MVLICPKCGGINVVFNGGIRALCKTCMKSFRKDKAKWQPVKNDEVYGNEHFPREVSIERLI